MNTILLFLIAIPAIEIYVMIKIGQNIGAFSTVSLIFVTAIIGVYFAKLEGLSTLRSGVYNLYKNKIPLYEMISGATIALAAILLIIPGFITDFFGFIVLARIFLKESFNFKKIITDKKELEKIILVDVPTTIYPDIRNILVFLFEKSGFKQISIDRSVDFKSLYEKNN